MKIKIETKIILVRAENLFFALLLLMATNSNAVLANDLHYNNSRITPVEMLSLTNQSREENGLSGLTVNQKLVDAAEAKTGDMFRYQYFEHNSPSGVTPWDWIKTAGYDYRYAGENLAIDFVTAEGAHQALMASSSHRENILNWKYTEIGISVKRDIFEKSESTIIVMEFGAPLNVRAVHADSGNADENIELSNSVKLDNNKNNIIGDADNKKQKPQKKITNSQVPAVSPNVKKDNNQNAGKNIEKQENKKLVHLNNENSKGSKEIACNAGMIKFIEMSASSIKKDSLEKVYLEDIYWKNCSKKNISGQTIVMSSGEQNKGSFNLNIFYTCILSILFISESLYIFSNFTIGKKLKMEKIQSGES